MMKKMLFCTAILMSLILFAGCSTSFGIARMPDNSTLFISASPEDGFVMKGDLDFPFQPIGYVEASGMKFKPCGGASMQSSYEALEEVLANDVTKKVRDEMGADALINVDWDVTPGIITMVNIKGLAVKRVQ